MCSRHIFSRNMFSRNECFQHFVFLEMRVILINVGYFFETRAGVAFSPLCAGMVLCSIRESGP